MQPLLRYRAIKLQLTRNSTGVDYVVPVLTRYAADRIANGQNQDAEVEAIYSSGVARVWQSVALATPILSHKIIR